MFEIIYQNESSGRISKLRNCNLAEKELVLSETKTYLKDCDEDSYLIKGNFPPDPELGRIMSYTDVKFSDSLIPVLAQDREGTILMQAFTNQDGLQKTFEKNLGHYYSRSRSKLWLKGEESGHTQEIFIVEYSPLYNYIVYRVDQKVCACHTGYYSCFYREVIGSQEKFVFKAKLA